MGEIKWIKLSVNMFDDEKIKLIRTMPEGDSIIIIWVQILCLAGKINDGGSVYMGQNLAYSDEMLATILDHPLNIMRVALQTLEQFEMIEVSDEGKIDIINWEKHQSTDKMQRIKHKNRERQQRYYYRNKLRELGVDVDVKGFPEDIEELKELTEKAEEPNVRLTLANGTEVRSKKLEVRSKKLEVRSKKREVNKEQVQQPSRKLTFDDTQYELAELLWEKIKTNFPNNKEPNLEAWANDIRLMMEQDNRTVAEIRGVIEWSQKHDFWYANIQSAGKLRKQYEQMYAQADREKKRGRGKGKKKETLPDDWEHDPQDDVLIDDETSEDLQARLDNLKKLREGVEHD